jgi:hypothetical protein
MLALSLAVPVVSFAGSATSRFDVTIGGFVKFDMGYATQGVGADYTFAQRASGHTTKNILDEYDNFYMAAGETRLNFRVKGPDAWGAKTSAFIEGDFRGAYGAATSYGVYQLRHAYLKFEWPESSLLFGQTWMDWGYLPSYYAFGFNELGPFLKSTREPQITWNQSITKEFQYSLSLFSPTNSMNVVGGANLVNDYTRGYPHLTGELRWSTDSCGKIGPWNLQFAVGGFFGQERATYVTGTNTRGGTVSGTAAAVTGTQYAADFSDDYVNSWATSFKWYIPIIPEKKPGAKGGAFGFAGAVFTGQNFPKYLRSFGLGSYDQDTTLADANFVAPKVWGGWAQLNYYLNDQWSVNFQYGYGHYTFSQQYQLANPNNVETVNHYIGNLIYDVNAAVRLGLEATYIYNRYAAPVSGVKTDGDMFTGRFAAYYFF